MTALPPASSEQVGKLRLKPDALSAYNVCLDFEREAAKTDPIRRIRARVLGYLILYAPSIRARQEVIIAIHSCSQNKDDLSERGKGFINYFIRTCKLFTVLQEKAS